MSKPFLLIAGPCVIESESLTLEIAAALQGIAEKLGLELIFKASFDKANRSAGGSFRGLGLEEGLGVLARVKETVGVRVTTDIHESTQVAAAAQVIDLLQIPAFLCRQTDLLLAAAQSGRAVNVKKGQFLAPEDMNNVADKLKEGGCKDYWFTERGTTFGYHNLVVDMRGLATMRAAGHRVIFDATHSVQRPGALGKATGGDGAMAPVLARAAVAVGIDGLFIETHPNPAKSPSDGPNMIPLADMETLLRKLLLIHEVARDYAARLALGLAVVSMTLGGTARAGQMDSNSMPVGSVVNGFVMPQRNAQGDLQSNITGDTATIVSPNRTVITGLKVEMYDATGKTVTTTITAPQCDFWPLERRLSGHHGVVIDRPEAHITAEDVDWDFKTQTAVLHKNVHVVLSKFAVGKPSAPAPAPAH